MKRKGKIPGPKAEVIKGETKIKYVFPLDKRCIKTIRSMSKPYPKKISVTNETRER